MNNSKPNKNKIPKLILSLLIPISIGGLSGYITRNDPGSEWFKNLTKPFFNPPGYLFGPVWTVLYILMGISLYLIWTTHKTPLRQKALIVFAVQLFFNFWWSILFFSFHTLLIALVEILLLWSLIIYMIKLFKKIKPLAGYFQVPYLLWVSFATFLNLSIWFLNK